VVDVQEMVYHHFRLLRSLAFTSGVKCQALVRIGAAGNEVVKVGDVATCGDFVEKL
jgi:hypothetical protein